MLWRDNIYPGMHNETNKCQQLKNYQITKTKLKLREKKRDAIKKKVNI
jgi:hypothetical protein